jgi:hypothetical protein
VSHNPHATQPPEVTAPCGHCPCCQARTNRRAQQTRIAPNRKCGCPHLEHEHGCRNRYDKGCRCEPCKHVISIARQARRGTLGRNPRVHPKRSCGCPSKPHEHGCRNRHRIDGCDGSECGGACRLARSRYEAARRKRYRKHPLPLPDVDSDADVDWVVVERLVAGVKVKANEAEVAVAAKHLRARGLSCRNLPLRARLEVAA